MNRDNWYSNNYLYVLAGLIVLAAVFLASNFLCNDSQDRASVVRVAGSVTIKRGSTKIIPTKGMVLNPYDQIITGKDASIEVTYDDGLKDIIRIGSNSHAVLESDVIQKQSSVFLDKGEILLKLEKLEKGSNFKVRTPTAVAGVRGTSFGVQLKGREAVITDFESRIYVKGLDHNFIENQDELLLNEGWKVRVRQFESPSRVEQISSQEREAWLSWINEVAANSSYSSLKTQNNPSSHGLLALFQSLFLEIWNVQGGLSAMFMKMMSSASVMAFMLYFALMINLRKVFV